MVWLEALNNDVAVSARVTAFWLTLESRPYPDSGLEIAAETTEKSESAFVFRKGSTELTAAVDKALADLRADGTLAKISEKYFGADVTKSLVDVLNGKELSSRQASFLLTQPQVDTASDKLLGFE